MSLLCRVHAGRVLDGVWRDILVDVRGLGVGWLGMPLLGVTPSTVPRLGVAPTVACHVGGGRKTRDLIGARNLRHSWGGSAVTRRVQIELAGEGCKVNCFHFHDSIHNTFPTKADRG